MINSTIKTVLSITLSIYFVQTYLLNRNLKKKSVLNNIINLISIYPKVLLWINFITNATAFNANNYNTIIYLHLKICHVKICHCCIFRNVVQFEYLFHLDILSKFHNGYLKKCHLVFSDSQSYPVFDIGNLDEVLTQME